jgi:hypothetical protein
MTMQALGETAAEHTTQPACGQPHEVWIVTDKDGEMPRVCATAQDAEVVRAFRNIDMPSLKPFRVRHYVEQPA